jgi:hypothetical protein
VAISVNILLYLLILTVLIIIFIKINILLTKLQFLLYTDTYRQPLYTYSDSNLFSQLSTAFQIDNSCGNSTIMLYIYIRLSISVLLT